MERVAESAKQHEPSPAVAGHGHAASPAAAPLPPALELQQLAGNQAMQELLRSGFLQAKLAISNPDDPEEREADNIAHTIMRKSAGAPCSCSPGEEMCEECQQKQSTPAIQRRASSPPVPAHIPRIVSDVLRSPGHPLDSATRAFFEPRFGRDFSDVRVHTGADAAASARSIHAHAYTAGSDIVFAPGQYSPDTASGRSLLAHELTHVGQQVDRDARIIRRQADAGAPAPDGGTGAAPAKSITEQVLAALSKPGEVAGVGDYQTAFTLLNGLSMADMLNVLQQVEAKSPGAVSRMLANSSQAAGLDIGRLTAALLVVDLIVTPAADINVHELEQAAARASQLPIDQGMDIIQHMISVLTPSASLKATLEGAAAMMSAAPLALPSGVLAGITSPIGPGPWNPPGQQPIPFYIGNQAHVGIAAEYLSFHLGQAVFTNFIPISAILSQIGVVPKASADLEGKPDIANLTLFHLYEIKPEGSEALALELAEMYMGAFLLVGVPMKLGPTTEPGTSGVLPAPGGYYMFTCPEPGVIVYQYRRGTYVPVRVPGESSEKEKEQSGEPARRIQLPQLSPQEATVITEMTLGALMLFILMRMAPAAL